MKIDSYRCCSKLFVWQSSSGTEAPRAQLKHCSSLVHWLHGELLDGWIKKSKRELNFWLSDVVRTGAVCVYCKQVMVLKHVGGIHLVNTKNCDENTVVKLYKIVSKHASAHVGSRYKVFILLLKQRTEIKEAIAQNRQN